MDAALATRPSRNPRFDRKRERSRSPTVARSLSPPRTRCRRRRSPSPSRSPSPAKHESRHVKRQRTASRGPKEDGAPRPISQRGGVRHTGASAPNNGNRSNNRSENRPGDRTRQRSPKPVESWADDASSDDDVDNNDDRDEGAHQVDSKRARRAPSPCLVPDSEEDRGSDDDDGDYNNNINDVDDDRDASDVDHVDDCERDGSDDDAAEEKEESRFAAGSSVAARTDDERTRALRTLASTAFAVSGPGGHAYKRPKRSGRRGKGSAERRRLRMMQQRLGLDAVAPGPVERHAGPAHTRHADDRRAQRGDPMAVADNAGRHRHGRGETGRHHVHRVATDEETLRRQRISTIDAKKHINAYHEACRRACIDRVPPPPPPPENMFALVSDAVDLFLAGRTGPRTRD